MKAPPTEAELLTGLRLIAPSLPCAAWQLCGRYRRFLAGLEALGLIYCLKVEGWTWHKAPIASGGRFAHLLNETAPYGSPSKLRRKRS